ncbi:MAG: alpha/beta fold hydrolase [Maricaulaceae bacterium]|nr:alpha/beta fold hydrolase [Maricaulaceae bacterium]
MRVFLGTITAALLLALIAVVLLWPRPQPASPEPAGIPAAYRDSPWLLAQDRFIPLDGMIVRVREEGPPEAPAVILFHGFTFSLESFDAWAEGLRGDFRVIRADLPGHGFTGPDPQERYSVPETAAFIGALMDALEIERAAVAGNSLGGLAAWRFAAENPDRVTRLVLIAPGAYSINNVTEIPVPVPPMVEAYLRQAPAPFVAAATAALYGDPARLRPETLARVQAMMTAPGNGDAFVRRLSVFTLPAPEATLARVSAPTLILWGGRDAMIPAAHGERLVRDIPHARLIVYDDLGHVPHEEAAARTLADARVFLSGE